jgi:hypothetical protein
MERPTTDVVVTIPTNTGETLKGKFTFKLSLSYREILEMDQMRRALLGPQQGETDPQAFVISQGLAKINTHLVAKGSPTWWRDSNNGLDLEDINIVLKVFEELNKAEKAHVESLKTRADKAVADLET